MVEVDLWRSLPEVIVVLRQYFVGVASPLENRTILTSGDANQRGLILQL
jgi:hypothetical protein